MQPKHMQHLGTSVDFFVDFSVDFSVEFLGPIWGKFLAKNIDFEINILLIYFSMKSIFPVDFS